MLTENKLQNRKYIVWLQLKIVCVRVWVCVYFKRSEKKIHQSVNRDYGRCLLFFLCGFLTLPKIIHINIFIIEKNN